MLCYLLLVVVASTWLPTSSDEVYTSAMLKRIAELDDWIDDTVNPCDDFEKYLCSKVDLQYITSATLKNAKGLGDFITKESIDSDGDAVKKFFTFYNTCKKEISKRNETIKLILNDLDDIFKDENGKYAKFDAALIAKVSAYLSAQFDFSIFMMLTVAKPTIKPVGYSKGDMVLAVVEPVLSQERYIYDPKDVSTQADVIKEGLRDAYVFLEPTKSEAEVNATLLEFLYFETNVSSLFAFPSKGMLELAMSSPCITTTEASVEFPIVDWKNFITLLSNYIGADIFKRYKLEEFPIQVLNPTTTKGLPDIIAKTPDELLRNYIRVRLVRHLMAELGEESCLTLTAQTFKVVKQYLYIVERYPKVAERQKLKSSLTKLADSVISHVRSMMEKVSWMKNDNQTFAGFTDKMNTLTKTIAFPDTITNQTWRDEHYKDLIITDADNLYSLYLKGRKFQTSKDSFESIIEVLNDITAANAAYGRQENKFVIYLGILHDLAYHPDYVPAYNYGFLGSIIGHEIIHGYDTEGINFDGEGFVSHWMSEKSQESFNTMASCVVDWYSKFNLTDSKGKVWQVNGNLTSAENVADIGGLRASYNAFKSDPANMQPFPRTKKLQNLTQEQLFFLGFGRFHCAPPLKDYELIYAFNDNHSPYQFRLLGALQNFVPFREAFNCPANSKHAPEKHCEVYQPDLSSGAVTLIPSIILLVTVFYNNQ